VADGPSYRTLRDTDTLRLLLQRLEVGVYITTRSGEILDANPAFLALLGFDSLEQLRTLTVDQLFADPAQRAREKELLDRQGQTQDFELQLRHATSGEVRTVLDTCYAVTDPQTGESLCHGILVDITERKRLEEKLQEAAIRDPLTGCFNRRYLEQIDRRLSDEHAMWGTIILDIDNFKSYNDRFGHKTGDEVLVQLSRFLMRQVRAEDAVVRMGGDEFLMLLLGEHARSTERVARRLGQRSPDQVPYPFTLGWATRRERETLEQTIIRADRQLIRVRLIDRSEERRARPTPLPRPPEPGQ
jgi:diguanylate cyclase (GGDEF)-like protein/PAS domain S-box-containing protein